MREGSGGEGSNEKVIVNWVQFNLLLLSLLLVGVSYQRISENKNISKERINP